jgi:hypothetical protein
VWRACGHISERKRRRNRAIFVLYGKSFVNLIDPIL